jgi:hypothetical protein
MGALQQMMLSQVIAAAGGSPTYDAVSSSSVVGGTSATWSHTCTGSNRVLVVSVAILGDSSVTVSGVTYNGVAMTSRYQGDLSTSGVYAKNSVWTLVAPATGANNIVATYSGTNTGYAGCGAVSFTGVNQTTPIRTVYSAGPGGTTATLTATDSVSGDIVIAGVSAYDGGTTLAADQTSRVLTDPVSGTSYAFAMQTKVASGASTVMSWTGAANYWTEWAFALRP